MFGSALVTKDNVTCTLQTSFKVLHSGIVYCPSSVEGIDPLCKTNGKYSIRTLHTPLHVCRITEICSGSQTVLHVTPYNLLVVIGYVSIICELFNQRIIFASFEKTFKGLEG